MSPILLDGALGTLLEERGYDTSGPLWSARVLRDHPDAVAQIHREYAEAGATHHTACTFRTQPLRAHEQAQAFAIQAVALAKAAVPATHRVLASLAPVVDCYDNGPPQPADEAHYETLAHLLAEAAPDGILVETFANPAHGILATKAALRTGLPTWVSLTPGFRGDLMSPSTLVETATHLHGLGAEVVMVNCLPVERSLEWVRPLAEAGISWGVYANICSMKNEDKPYQGIYTEYAKRWLALKPKVLGGCCGTDPRIISGLSRLLG